MNSGKMVTYKRFVWKTSRKHDINATVGNFKKGFRLKLHGRIRSGFKLVICDQNILFLNLKNPIFWYRIKILLPYYMEGFLLVQNINI